MTMEKLLPQNIEAERGVLGSLLIDPDVYDEVSETLRESDFYRESHRHIYQSVVDLRANGEAADLITITDELARRGLLDDIGGVSYVSALANQVPTSANADYYARIVKRTSTMRRLIHAAGQIAAIAYNEPDADAALEQAEKLIFAIASDTTAPAEASVREIVSDMFNTLERLQEARQANNGVLGVPTGFADMDRMLGGLQKSDLIILAARPAVGKTSLALSIADQAASRYGRRTMVYSMEMSREQIGQRWLSMRAGVDNQRLRQGDLNEDEWAKLSTVAGDLADAGLWVDDTPALTLNGLRSRARRAMLRHQLDLIVVDYLQLMHSHEENRMQEVSAIARGLKELARELNVPVLALSQLSRAVEGRQEKTPQLSDLRESGEIEQAADIVAFIYRDEVYNPDTEKRNIADVIIAKHRHGPTGTFSLFFQKATTRFRDLARGPLPERLTLDALDDWARGQGASDDDD